MKNMISNIPNNLSKASPLASHVTTIAGLISEHHRSKVEIEKVYAQLDLMKTEMERRYGFFNSALDKTFKERKELFEMFFSTIDKAINEKQYDVVIKALDQVESIATDSPLKSIESLIDSIRGRNIIDI